MIALAKLSIRRPKAAVLAWLVVGLALSIIGLGVSNSLSPSVTVVPGTQSARAQQLADARFGPTQLVPILLEGSQAQLNRQGPPLVAALARRAHTRVMSAWDGGSVTRQLRISPTSAMIIASVDRPEKQAVLYDQPQIERLVSQKITAPVRSFITGQPSIDRAERAASISNLRATEAIAIGIIFLLLLIGLRAPVAAALVTAVGAISMLAGFGAVALIGKLIAVDPIAVTLGTMTGLALGVGFALLILDRFRRERDQAPVDAAAAAVAGIQGTGRAVLVGGTAVAAGLGISAIVGPTQLMVSLGAGMLTCALFATGGAVVVMPAALVLLDRRLQALSFAAPRALSRVSELASNGGNRVTRHLGYAGFVALALLALAAVPALSLKSGPADISALPSSAKARIAFEEISRVAGPGFATPYNLIVVAGGRPITTPALLASLTRFQHRIAANPAVKTVIGPGASDISSTAQQLASFGPGLKQSVKLSKRSKKDLLALIKGLGLAGNGSAALKSGLAAAATGSGQAQSGAGQLQAGLSQALAGAVALRDGAGQALSGARQLQSGLASGHSTAAQGLQGFSGLKQLTSTTKSQAAGAQGGARSAATQIAAALSALNSVTAGKGDPLYSAAAADLKRASSAISSLEQQTSNLAGYAAQTDQLASSIASQMPGQVNDLQRAVSGSSQLSAGIAQLQSGNGQLASGLTQLTGGAGQLEAGLASLTSGLAGGVSPAGKLVNGLKTMRTAVKKSRNSLPSTADLEKLFKQSPGMFNSGYFVLAALAGANPTNRTDASFAVNLLNGGNAGQIVITSRYAFSDPRSQALGGWLADMASTFAKANNVQAAVGGPAGNLGDLTSTTKSRIWLDVLLSVLAIALILAIALRAVLLPIVATLLALLTSAATFGILQLLYGGSEPALGGNGVLDPMTIIGIFVIAFGVSVTYAALVVMRTREAYVSGRDPRAAVAAGLRQTTVPAIGAALVMLAAIIPFAVADFANVSRFGVGIAVAIALDVLIFSSLLMPAAEAVLGRRGWWPTPPAAPGEPGTAAPAQHRLPALHLPRRGPRPAH